MRTIDWNFKADLKDISLHRILTDAEAKGLVLVTVQCEDSVAQFCQHGLFREALAKMRPDYITDYFCIRNSDPSRSVNGHWKLDPSGKVRFHFAGAGLLQLKHDWCLVRRGCVTDPPDLVQVLADYQKYLDHLKSVEVTGYGLKTATPVIDEGLGRKPNAKQGVDVVLCERVEDYDE